MESYKHQFAKQTLARWLARADQKLVQFENESGGGPYGGGVFIEYPFCINSRGTVFGGTPWHEMRLKQFPHLENDVPSYQQCIDAQFLPICIFDVAIQHRGQIVFAFEIVHKHDLTDEKRKYINRIGFEHYSPLRCVYGIDADDVLSQTGLPTKIKPLWRILFRD